MMIIKKGVFKKNNKLTYFVVIQFFLTKWSSLHIYNTADYYEKQRHEKLDLTGPTELCAFIKQLKKQYVNFRNLDDI